MVTIALAAPLDAEVHVRLAVGGTALDRHVVVRVHGRSQGTVAVGVVVDIAAEVGERVGRVFAAGKGSNGDEE